MSTTLPRVKLNGLSRTGSAVSPAVLFQAFEPDATMAWLLPATMPPAGRTILVNGVEAWIELSHIARFSLGRSRSLGRSFGAQQ